MTDDAPSSDPLPTLVSEETLLTARPFDVVRATIRFPDGFEAERVIAQHPGAVALVVIDDDGRWLLVRQYRHPASDVLLEVPAGTRDDGEAPEVTAAREVREETGYAAESLVHVGGTWMAPGFSSEYIDYYLATGLRPDPLPQDDDEYLSEPVRLTLEEVDAAIGDGTIRDAKTVVALSLYERLRRQG